MRAQDKPCEIMSVKGKRDRARVLKVEAAGRLRPARIIAGHDRRTHTKPNKFIMNPLTSLAFYLILKDSIVDLGHVIKF
jgi:hypothetical protein